MNDIEVQVDDAYRRGLMDGIRRFAYWKDGRQYVGCGSKTYEEAIQDVHKECLVSGYRQPY